jgi:hypothetical protein
MKDYRSSVQHKLLAALCYWVGLLWIPMLLEIARRSVYGGLWNEFGGKPMAVVFATVFFFPPITLVGSIGCQVIYWRCLRKIYPHLDYYGRATANLGLAVILALILLFIGIWLPIMEGYLWPVGLWSVIFIYSLASFCGGLMAFYGRSLNLPQEIRFFR